MCSWAILRGVGGMAITNTQKATAPGVISPGAVVGFI